jgi:ABC-2 type transport system permease protein
VVPNFSQVMAAAINREIFLQTIGAQQSELTATLRDVELLADTLEVAISAADVGDRVTTREQVQQARDRSAALDDALAPLGPEVVSLREQIARLQASLQRADEQLAPDAQPSPTSQQPLRERLGLVAARQSVQTIGDILRRFTTIAPEVVISPLTIDAQNVAQLEPDIVTFFAPSLLALLVQHIAVSMGVLAIVRERLGGMFELYRVAPLRNLGLLLGKYVAYSGFTLVIASIVLGVLLWGIGVPVLGSPWQLGVTLVLLTLASVGLGLLLSLLALSEHQAVQFAMLTLLAIVFFSGFVLPLDAISRPLRIVSALLPATHGVVLLQNAMLRGGPVDTQALFALLAMALLLFGTCLGVLHWRTRPM